MADEKYQNVHMILFHLLLDVQKFTQFFWCKFRSKINQAIVINKQTNSESDRNTSTETFALNISFILITNNRHNYQ